MDLNAHTPMWTQSNVSPVTNQLQNGFCQLIFQFTFARCAFCHEKKEIRQRQSFQLFRFSFFFSFISSSSLRLAFTRFFSLSLFSLDINSIINWRRKANAHRWNEACIWIWLKYLASPGMGWSDVVDVEKFHRAHLNTRDSHDYGK